MAMMNLVASFRQVANNVDKSMLRITEQPAIKREIEYYKTHIGEVKSLEDFINDKRLFSFAMTAFGLKDMIYAKAYMKKALADGIDKPDAFSLRLADSRFREFVETFNFSRHKSATTSFDRAQQGTIAKFVRGALEEQAGQQNEGLRLALYFQRKAGALSNTYNILADKAIYTVVRTALGLPLAMSATDIDKQAALLSERVNVADFADPVKLDKFIARFIGQYETQNSAITSSPALSLMASASTGIDMATLMSIQSLKKHGG
jgi:Protein of unknown function (DUF1217)